MSLSINRFRIFVYEVEIDMRSSFERLSHFVKEKMKRELELGDIFLFFGRSRKRLKVLFFDGTGLILVIKRLEVGKFLRLSELSEKKELTVIEMNKIFQGSAGFLSTVDLNFSSHLLDAGTR